MDSQRKQNMFPLASKTILLRVLFLFMTLEFSITKMNSEHSDQQCEGYATSNMYSNIQIKILNLNANHNE